MYANELFLNEITSRAKLTARSPHLTFSNLAIIEHKKNEEDQNRQNLAAVNKAKQQSILAGNLTLILKYYEKP